MTASGDASPLDDDVVLSFPEHDAPEEHDPRQEVMLLLDDGDDIDEATEAARTAERERGLADELSARGHVLGELETAADLAGHAGDAVVVKFVYLVAASRFFDRPANLAVIAASSAGKSHAVGMGLRALPAEAFYEMSAASDKALIYSDEPIKHRVLVMAEAAGISGGVMAYTLRTLLSEGVIRYEVTDFDKRGTDTITREGPTGLIVTSTKPLETELGTRIHHHHVAETVEQTHAVLRVIAGAAAGRREPDGGFRSLEALQRRLEDLRDVKVVVPFAEAVVDCMETSPMRMRRDFTTVMTFIKAHALLHYGARRTDEHGVLQATIADYAAVHELMAVSLAELAQTALGEHLVHTVVTVGDILEEQGAVGSRDVRVPELAARLGLDESSVRRRVMKLVDAGYLNDFGGGRGGTPHRLTIGAPLPADRAVLPSPSEVTAAWQRSRIG